MSFLKKIKTIFKLNALIQEEEKRIEILEEKALERTEEQEKQYEQWADSTQQYSLLSLIKNEYQHYSKNRVNKDRALDFLMIPSIRGFVLHFDPHRWDTHEFYCLQDCLRDKVKGLGYYLYMSDSKKRRCGKVEEHSERHYLKAKRSKDFFSKEPKDQRYGNIMIQVNMIDGKIVNLKFSATAYNDKQFKPAEDFSELMQTLF